MRGSCCPCPCTDLEIKLISMGLAPAEPPATCNGVNPQLPSTPPDPCVPGTPCCGPINLQTFLNGRVIGSIPTNSVRVTITGVNHVFTPNPFPLATLGDLLLYLNQFVLPEAQQFGCPILGTGAVYGFQVVNNVVVGVIPPKICGSCTQRLTNVLTGEEGEAGGLTMLVASQEGAVVGDIVAPVDQSPAGLRAPAGVVPALPGGLPRTVSNTGRSRESAIGVPALSGGFAAAVSETIATRAKAQVLPTTGFPNDSDGWAVVIGIQPSAVPGFDRVFVKTVGEHFLLDDLGTSPRRADWEALRDPTIGDARGAYVGADAGKPINGPAWIVQPTRFTPGAVVVSPRVAMPVDLMVGGVVRPGFRLGRSSPDLSVGTVPGSVATAADPKAPEPEAKPPKAGAAKLPGGN